MNSRKKRRQSYLASQISWQDVWELPLHLVGFYAYSKNETMALSFEWESKEAILEARKIVAIINGEEESDRQHEYTHNGYADIFRDAENFVFCVR